MGDIRFSWGDLAHRNGGSSKVDLNELHACSARRWISCGRSPRGRRGLMWGYFFWRLEDISVLSSSRCFLA